MLTGGIRHCSDSYLSRQVATTANGETHCCWRRRVKAEAAKVGRANMQETHCLDFNHWIYLSFETNNIGIQLEIATGLHFPFLTPRCRSFKGP